ncbi:S9 family peptidase [Fluviispira multicolorata]|uniref:Alpha/beta fold hydrolase n=1 Tax=Fluviispira multicolorata TaxID=2654512 RepID=A0A833JHF0_9BACT|nr:S9 family peptidase [Fluviispira multicolorata]KAB8033478.1 alpha/beta fold hydrolase [Fluviispira multicolorata]
MKIVHTIFRISLIVFITNIMTHNIKSYAIDKKNELIPKKVLFGNPDKASVAVSPDGEYISYLAPYNGVLNIYVAPINNIEQASPITNNKDRGISAYFWSYNKEYIVYLQDQDGDENWQIYGVHVKNKKEKKLTNFQGVRAEINNLSEKFPNEILVSLNNRNKELHDLYKLNIINGKLTKIYENNDFSDIITDDTFKIRLALKQTDDGGSNIYKINSKLNKKLFYKIDSEDINTTGIVGFNKEADSIYFIDSKNQNTAALYSLNLKDNKKQLIYSNNHVDVNAVLLHPTRKSVEAVSFNYLKQDWKIIDQGIKKDFDYLKSKMKGELNIVNRSLDNKIWIIADIQDNFPVSYYKYDSDKKKADFLFLNRQDLKKYKLATMHPVVIPTRDNMELVSYLTLPFEVQSASHNFKPLEKVPLVLFVHGGPTARDYWGLNLVHQWLSNRGYAVLSVNYRGSTGFGKEFINAGNGEWAGKMHDDLIDAVNWAIQQDVTEKDKVAIMGGSYGGYATLVGLTFTPDVFACGIDIVGPSNLLTLLKTIPPYWKPALNSLKLKLGGDPETEEGIKILESKSPLNFASKIKKPLLIAQGANDPRVKQSESDQIVAAMKAKNIPVTYVLYPDEGHGFSKPQNRISFYAMTESFLASQLKGWSEKSEDDFKGSSLIIKEGSNLKN